MVTFTTVKFQWESVQSRIWHEGKNVSQADFAGVQVGHANSPHWPTERWFSRFKRDFSVWCTLIMAALLPMKDVCKISIWPHLKPKVVELLLPSAFGDIWGSWGIWDRIHRGREWAERWAPVGMERSTKASVCAGPAQYSLCSSFASQCHHDCGRTPSYRSCAGQMGYHLNCPESPEIRE